MIPGWPAIEDSQKSHRPFVKDQRSERFADPSRAHLHEKDGHLVTFAPTGAGNPGDTQGALNVALAGTQIALERGRLISTAETSTRSFRIGLLEKLSLSHVAVIFG